MDDSQTLVRLLSTMRHVPFFPFCKCTEQKHDDAVNRMLHIRRNAADDGMVATHILECLLVGDTHVHAQVFCPTKGSRLAGLYTVVYVAKKDPEARLNTMHSDDTDVNVLLKERTVGLPMKWHFINAGQFLGLSHEVLCSLCLFESQGCCLQNWERLHHMHREWLPRISLCLNCLFTCADQISQFSIAIFVSMVLIAAILA